MTRFAKAFPEHKHNRFKELGTVPNDRVLLLPLRIGNFKDASDDAVVDVCRACGKTIVVGDRFAAFYQGDLRLNVGHLMALAVLAHDTIWDQRSHKKHPCINDCYQKCY